MLSYKHAYLGGLAKVAWQMKHGRGRTPNVVSKPVLKSRPRFRDYLGYVAAAHAVGVRVYCWRLGKPKASREIAVV